MRSADEEQLDHVLPEVGHELLAEVCVTDAVVVRAGDHHRQRTNTAAAVAAPRFDRGAEVDEEVGAVAVVTDDDHAAEVERRGLPACRGRAAVGPAH